MTIRKEVVNKKQYGGIGMEVNSIDSKTVIELGQNLKSVEKDEDNIKQVLEKEEPKVENTTESSQFTDNNPDKTEGKILDLLG